MCLPGWPLCLISTRREWPFLVYRIPYIPAFSINGLASILHVVLYALKTNLPTELRGLGLSCFSMPEDHECDILHNYGIEYCHHARDLYTSVPMPGQVYLFKYNDTLRIISIPLLKDLTAGNGSLARDGYSQGITRELQ